MSGVNLGAFCADESGGRVLKRDSGAWDEVGREFQTPKPDPVWSQARLL